jgi:dTDP-4-dehydrorhamnose reductase
LCPNHMILRLLQESRGTDRRPEPGTYHVSGEGQCSWFEFAEAILLVARKYGILNVYSLVTLNPLTSAQYPTRAKRPGWSVLSKERLFRW